MLLISSNVRPVRGYFNSVSAFVRPGSYRHHHQYTSSDLQATRQNNYGIGSRKQNTVSISYGEKDERNVVTVIGGEKKSNQPVA